MRCLKSLSTTTIGNAGSHGPKKKDTESVNRVEEKVVGMDMVSSKIRAAYRGVPSHPFKATLAMVCFNFGLLLLVSQMLFNSHHHESRI